MCYDVSAKKRSIKKQALRLGYSENEIEKLFERSDLPLYHTSAFTRPSLPVFSKNEMLLGTWGFTNHWAKKTFHNARGETIFKLKSFKTSALNRRCILWVDGFFEHHHFMKKTYPFFIQRSDQQTIALAALYKQSKDITEFTIVTCKGNEVLAQLHNNPNLPIGPRMPFILADENNIEQWLATDLSTNDIMDLIQPYPADGLNYHTVNRLRKPGYIGNEPDIIKPFSYPELKYNFDT